MSNQKDALLEYLEKNKSVTPMEALRDLGVFRLAARIFNLREMGYTINMVRETDGTKHWARYSLGKKEQLVLALGEQSVARD